MESSSAQSGSGLNDWLNSEEAQELRNAWKNFERQQAAEDCAWWDSLSYEQKAQAFRQIMRLMHKAEVQDRGTYRWAIYEVFGLDYGDGLDHYMDLHNLISAGLEAQSKRGGVAARDDNKVAP